MRFIRLTHRITVPFFRMLTLGLWAPLLVGSFTNIARADCVPSTEPFTPKEVTPASKEWALGRYNAGNELLKKNDFEGALVLFLESRRLWPKRSNTKNAAICLFELGRYPEALAMYEELLERFGMDFDEEERALITTTVDDLKKRVLTVDLKEPRGTFSIDDEPCGALPRKRPVYLMPGTHILRLLRPGEPEVLTQFTGNGGQRVAGEIKKPVISILIPEKEKWFAMLSAGPVFGFSLVRSTADGPINLETMTGGIAQVTGGFRLPNGLSFMLASGAFYAEREYPAFRRTFVFGPETKPLAAAYDIESHLQVFAPFMGVMVGYESLVRRPWDWWIRAGAGILGVQAKRVLNVDVQGPGSQTDRIFVEKKSTILYEIPAYLALDLGFSLRVGRLLRIGFGLQSSVIMHNGPSFPTSRIQPRERIDSTASRCDSPDDVSSNIRCVPGVTLESQPSYHPSFLLMPQVVVGVGQ